MNLWVDKTYKLGMRGSAGQIISNLNKGGGTVLFGE